MPLCTHQISEINKLLICWFPKFAAHVWQHAHAEVKYVSLWMAMLLWKLKLIIGKITPTPTNFTPITYVSNIKGTLWKQTLYAVLLLISSFFNIVNLCILVCHHKSVPSVKMSRPQLEVTAFSDHLLVKWNHAVKLKKCHCQVKYGKVRPSLII